MMAARGRGVATSCGYVAVLAAMVSTAHGGGCGGCTESDKCGDVLILTPLIERGEVAAARAAALVSNLAPLLDGSYSAVLTTDAAKRDSLWFWFLPALSGDPSAPTLVWLQGGPGAPSTYGMFTEIGPVIVEPDGSFSPRNESWNLKLNLLIIDNPAGVGWSPLGDVARPVVTEHEVGLQLTEFLRQFTLLFPDQSKHGIIIAGESYGGKYAPSAAAAVDLYNANGGSPQIPLKGLVVADGWCDPSTHAASYAAMLYGMGLLDDFQRAAIEARMQQTVDLIAKGQLVAAFDPWNSVWQDYGGAYPGKSFVGPSLFTNFTGGQNTENVWFSGADPAIPSYDAALEFMCRPSSRKALHIGNASFEVVDQYGAMVASGDVMNTSKPAIEHVLSAGKYKVLLYSGAWDGVVGAAVSEPLYAALEWPGRAAFTAGGREPYRVAANDTEVAGFAREVVADDGTRLVRVVVRRAGHILPADQPRVARDMIERFVFDDRFLPK